MSDVFCQVWLSFVVQALCPTMLALAADLVKRRGCESFSGWGHTHMYEYMKTESHHFASDEEALAGKALGLH